MIAIAGDIGGTKSWLALLYRDGNGGFKVIHEARYRSQEFESIERLLQQFLEDSNAIADELEQLVLALPGPVGEGAVQLTNLNWQVNSSALQERFSLSKVKLVNDFQAAAMGTLTLQAEDYTILNRGMNGENGIRLVIGAGTGLGMAYLYREGGRYIPVATEGGHVDFAPSDEREFALLKYLQGQFQRVSYERILSGDGLVALFQFCAGETADNPRVTAEWVNSEATVGHNPVAVASLELFASIYGRFVGNMVLAFRPGDGVYLTGGVSAKVGRWLNSDEFRGAYLDKGRMLGIVVNTPVYLVTNERLGLQGAISVAGSL